jgi:hypothetical protein
MNHSFENIQNYADLQNRLRNWTTFAGDPYAYDYNAMFHLLGACLDNIRIHGTEGDIEVIGLSLEPEQIEILVKLADAAKNPPKED